jgi:hypothetical protein
MLYNTSTSISSVYVYVYVDVDADVDVTDLTPDIVANYSTPSPQHP